VDDDWRHEVMSMSVLFKLFQLAAHFYWHFFEAHYQILQQKTINCCTM